MALYNILSSIKEINRHPLNQTNKYVVKIIPNLSFNILNFLVEEIKNIAYT